MKAKTLAELKFGHELCLCRLKWLFPKPLECFSFLILVEFLGKFAEYSVKELIYLTVLP